MTRHFTLRNACSIVLAGCTILLLVLLTQPLRITLIRLATLAAAGGIWMALLGLVWPRRWLRQAFVLLTALALCALLVPIRSGFASPTLRQIYVHELQQIGKASCRERV